MATRYDKYRLALSRAVLAHAEGWLVSQGLRPTQQRLAEALGTSQSMISQVRSGVRVFGLGTVLSYSERQGMKLGELHGELQEMLEEGWSPTAPAADRPSLPQRAFEGCEAIKRRVLQASSSGHFEAEALYGVAAVGALEVFGEAGSGEVVSAAVSFRRGEEVDLLVGRSGGAGEGTVRRLTGPVPANLRAALARAWGEPGGADGVHVDVVTRPGRGLSRREAAFWAALAGRRRRRTGRRLVLCHVPVFRAPGDGGDAVGGGISMLLLFEYGFEPTAEDRAAMVQLSDAVYRVFAAGLQACAGRLAGLLDLGGPWRETWLPRAAQDRWASAISSHAEQFCETLWQDEAIGSLIWRMELWRLDLALEAEFSRLYCRAAGAESAREGETWGPTSERWLRMTRAIVRSGQPMIDNPTVFGDRRDDLPAWEVGSILGLPLSLHDGEPAGRLPGVLYVLCDQVVPDGAEAVARILARAADHVGVDVRVAGPIGSAAASRRAVPAWTLGMDVAGFR